VRNDCTIGNDVFSLSGQVAGAQAAAHYENSGFNGPYVASVYAPDGGGRIVRTLVNGWTIGDQGTSDIRTTKGRHWLWQAALTGGFGNLLCGPLNNPVAVGDLPTGVPDAVTASFLRLRSSNPMRGGEARLALRLAATEKAEVRIYDVSGRRVREVAHRVFEGGKEHVVIWDGASDTGERVRPGLYFYRVRTSSFDGQRKVIVLN
ncbi:MAG: T9SS type A sorting domain-containing protein, partial [Candidatus Rokuibacteriota bacterium]